MLQEVGVARYIDVLCGSTQISAHVFCEGLGRLKLPKSFLTDVGPVALLMKGALFRPKFGVDSLGILPLGELLGLYRSYSATRQHDKIYALLGFSSDATSFGLQVNYTTPWHQLLKETLQFIFVGCHIQTWKDTASVVIEAKGWILGHITHVKSDSLGFGQQRITCHYHRSTETMVKVSFWAPGRKEPIWNYERTLFGCAELAQEGDLICQIQGQSFLSILRICDDHLSVILPCLRPSGKKEVECFSETLSECQLHHATGDYLTLTWDIPIPMIDEHLSKSKAPLRLRQIAPEFQEPKSDTNLRLDFLARILAEIATRSLHKMPRNKILWENIFEQCGALVPVSEVFELGCSAIFPVPNDFTNRDYGADLIKALFRQRAEDLQVSEQAMISAVGFTDSSVVETFMKYKGESVPMSEQVVIAAAENPRHEVLEALFLNHQGKRPPITEKVVLAATGNHRHIVLKTLLKYAEDRLEITEHTVIAAAGNSDHRVLESVIKYAGKSLQIPEQAVIKAIQISFHQVLHMSKLRLLLEHQGDHLPISEKAMIAAAKNPLNYGLQVFNLLKEHRRDTVPITQVIFEAASENSQYGAPMISFLREWQIERATQSVLIEE